MEPRFARYDRAYFDRWYRDAGFGHPDWLARKVDYALGAAEYLTGAPVTSVLDVGCGEGAWSVAVRERRPGVYYLGIDPSAYVIERYSKERNLVAGSCGDLDEVLTTHAPDRRFDLVVCVDVLGHVPAADVRAALGAIAARLDGVVLAEVFTRGDDWVGDHDGFIDRPTATYERWFAEAGMARIGPNLWAGDVVLAQLANLERP